MSSSGAERTASLIVRSFIHELRQPLVGLKAAVELVGGILPDEIRDSPDWTLARAQMARIEELTSTYQELYNTGRAATAPYDVCDAVDYVLELHSHRLSFLSDRLEVEVASDLPTGRGNRLALVHALGNILKNAADATAASGLEARIAVHVVASKGGIELRVSDNGSGIPAEIKKRVFDADFTTKAAGEGSGLGLYVARRLLEKTGSTLALVGGAKDRQPPWAVTQFLITVPVDGAASHEEEEPQVAAAVARPAQRRSALVVEDEAVVQLIMRRLLTPEGYDVRIAATGPEGIELLNTETFDLLLTDKNLPGCDGVEVVRAARALDRELPIIMVTGFPSAESARALLPLGIDAYIQKPFHPDEFITTVAGVVDRRASAQAPPAPTLEEVLLVERDGATRQRLNSILTGMGRQVHCFRDVAAAVDAHPEATTALISDALCDAGARLALYKRRAGNAPFSVGLIVDADDLGATTAAISLGARATVPRSLLDDEAALREKLEALSTSANE